jgi:hypothetical protein
MGHVRCEYPLYDIVIGTPSVQCMTTSAFGCAAKRLYAEARGGRSSDYSKVSLRSPHRITCDNSWAVIDEVAEFQPAYGDYAVAWGPVLLRYTDGQWHGVSAYVNPYGSGADPTPVVATNLAKCRQAPRALRTLMHC